MRYQVLRKTLPILCVAFLSSTLVMARQTDSETSGKAVKMLNKFKVSGYINMLYQHGQKDATLDVGSSNEDKEKSFDRFGVRRGRLKLTYEEGITSGVFQLDVTEKGIGIKDAYLQFRDPWIGSCALKVGVLDRPFGFESSYSSSQRESPERSKMFRTLLPDDRDLGIMLHLQPAENSALHFLSLQGGLFSGNAINIDTDNYKDLIARLEANKTNPYFSYSGGISYYLGGVYQGSPVVYSMQEKSFVAHIDPENKGKFALREYLGADVQLEFKNPFGRTCLIGEYIFGLQPASISTSKSPDANELPSHDTYLRDFTGAYVMLTQDIGKTPLTAVLKYDVYDPNRHVAGDEVGMKNTNKTDLEQRALGFGLLWAASSRIRLTAYYELNNYEHTSSMPLINDLKQDVFSLRLLCKF